MAIKYKFSCQVCKYQVQLTVGLSKMAFYNKDPDRELASCNNCKTLTITTDKRCPTCNVKAETGKWFSRKTGFKILDIRTTADNISCPKCDFKFITAIPIVFID